jgi:K+/H+ antiporter YhaU regulatory subunit KhtT
MFSIVSLLLVLVSSILVTRIATVALTHTGLSRESSKFQARSAFTGVGFTTQESEKVVNHPVRRKVLLLLMLLGNAGFVTAISSLIVSFVKVESSFSLFWQITLLVSGVVILWIIANSSFVDRHLSNLISKVLKKYTRFVVHDFSKLLHLAGDYQISEVYIGENHWMEGETIFRSAIRKEGITVLGITRKNGNYLGVPDGETMIEHGDTLILYGRAETIANLGHRKENTKGDYEHVKKVKVQQVEKKLEKQKDA